MDLYVLLAALVPPTVNSFLSVPVFWRTSVLSRLEISFQFLDFLAELAAGPLMQLSVLLKF